MSDIVVVDDDEMFHFLIERKSRKIDKPFKFFFDGEQAIEYMKQNPPEALILDIRMPKMDGYELLHELKKTLDLSKTQIIVSSSSNPPQRILDLFNDFSVSFILKENIFSHKIFQ